jgi:PleD family two-component response regulator
MNSQVFRILIVDDNPAIHEDFIKILINENIDEDFESLKSSLFGKSESKQTLQQYEITSATQGDEAIALITKALEDNHPFALAFVDIRMPPGMDGVETIKGIWQIDPHIQTVICSAYSDYSWAHMTASFGKTDRLLILKKPFDNIEVQQFAETLTHKFYLAQEVRNQINNLQSLVSKRTEQLEASVKQLEFNATHDLLTKLPNRSLLQDRITQMINKAEKNNTNFIVLFIDLNRFKKIVYSGPH